MGQARQTCTLALILAMAALAGSASACGQGELLFEDTFETLDPGWNFALSDNAKVGPEGLVLEYQPNSYFLALSQAGYLEDLEICGEFAIQFKEGSNAYGGLAFWAADRDNFYAVDIFPNFGTFAVYRTQKGKLLTPVPITNEASIKKEPGATNEISLVTQGSAASSS
jgi:hypothetical protein